jgi:hypothetical protein
MRLTVKVVLATHFVGCFFYWVSMFATSDSDSHWFQLQGLSVHSPLFDRYIASLYWAMTTVRCTPLPVALFGACVSVCGSPHTLTFRVTPPRLTQPCHC